MRPREASRQLNAGAPAGPLSGGGGGSGGASVEYDGCWTGAIADDSGTISISGCGSESFSCGSYCSIVAQKDDDSSSMLCVYAGGDSACTTAAYGVASV